MSATSSANDRRLQLARTLSKVAKAGIEEILAMPDNPETSCRARRIGITGPPGAGKSSLIAAWARARLEQGNRVGVLAIDPSSPLTQGSILGDRIRMEDVINNERFYLRSVSSGRHNDGLCHNVVNLLDVFEQYHFDDVVLETVGTGQADHNIRALVDTVALVLNPQSGDIVQAMKAGVMEIADIFVVNKADLDGARLTAQELRSVLDLSAHENAWRPPIVNVSCRDHRGIQELNGHIDEHQAWVREHVAPATLRRRRQDYQLAQLIAAQASQYLAENAATGGNLRERYEQLVSSITTS